MKQYIHSLNSMLLLFGFDARRALCSLVSLPRYIGDWRSYRQQSKANRDFPPGHLCPCLADRNAESGAAGGHYFYQDLLVARRVFENSPTLHVDVGSRVDGFVAHVAAFRRVTVLDIRPLPNVIPNVEFIQANLMQPPAGKMQEFCDSLSCLHTLEHFGLGRYGDPIDANGHLVGLSHLTEILKLGGRLYLSVPIGPQRVEFNAHRVFAVRYLLEIVQRQFSIERFSYVDDNGVLHENVSLRREQIERNYGCTYGCGILEMRKVR